MEVIKTVDDSAISNELAKLFQQRSLRYFSRVIPCGDGTKMPENRYLEIANWVVRTCRNSELSSEDCHTWRTMLAIVVGKEVEEFF